MNWIVGALVATFVIEAVKDKEKLVIKWSKRRKRLVFAKGALLAYLLLLLLGAGSVSAYRDSVDNGNKIDSLTLSNKFLDTTIFYLKDTIASLTVQSDTLKQKVSFHIGLSQGLHEANLSAQEVHEKNIQSQNSVNTEKMLNQYALGVKQGVQQNEKSTGFILDELSSARKKLDSLETALQPTLNYTLEDRPFKIKYSGDTTYFFTPVRNSGQTAATKVNYKVYFLEVKNNQLYEYINEIGEMSGQTIDHGETSTLLSGNIFIPHYKFDEINNRQHVVIIGDYWNDDEKHPVHKRFELCYTWHPPLQVFAISASPNIIINAHKASQFKIFSTFK